MVAVSWQDILAGAISAAKARGVEITPQTYATLELMAKGVADTLASSVVSPGATGGGGGSYVAGDGLDLVGDTFSVDSTVARRNAANVFTGAVTAPSFLGSGASLTSLAAANISPGTAGINISGSAASVPASGVTGAREPIVALGVITWNSATPFVAWGQTIDSAAYAGRTVTLEAAGLVTGAGLTGTVSLYNVTTSSTVGTLTFNSLSYSSQSTSVTLAAGSNVYEVRVALAGFVAGPDAVQLYDTALVATVP